MTWLFESGRSHLIVPFFRNSVIRLMIRWASAIGRGISSGVSLQAKPNIMPWSPAPMSLPRAAVFIDALGDVGRLLAERHHDGTGCGVEAHVARGVADLADDLANDCRIVNHGLGRDLAGQADEPGREQGFAGHASVGILCQDGIEDAVGNLVGHLVGMAHRYGFAREKIAIVIRHGRKSPSSRSLVVKDWPMSGRRNWLGCGLFTSRVASVVV